jgi:2-C-methyl-D-erythritol 4-phosphate cytidylyltransferase
MEGKVVTIIPAAGQGVRMGNNKKQLMKLNGTSILIHTLRKFELCPEVDELCLAVQTEDQNDIQELLGEAKLAKRVTIAPGGNRRQDSVENCLRTLPRNTALVVVHDAVRPFITSQQIIAAIEEAARSGACIVGTVCVDTVKQVDRTRVLGTIPRDRIVLAQTPQVFRYTLLMEAFKKAREEDYEGTDEASLVEHLGWEVTIVPGSNRNIKITTPEDLLLAGFYLEQEKKKSMRATDE